MHPLPSKCHAQKAPLCKPAQVSPPQTGCLWCKAIPCLQRQDCGCFRWRIVVKPMARDNADVSLLQQCPSDQLAQQLPVTASLPAPEALSSAAQLDQEVFAMLEVSTCMHPYGAFCCTLPCIIEELLTGLLSWVSSPTLTRPCPPLHAPMSCLGC